MSNYLFRAKTADGSAIKILVDLLNNIVKDICLEIDKGGIRIRTMDYHKAILLDVFLFAEKFNNYYFERAEPLNIGLSVSTLFKTLKNLKKNDSVELSIASKVPGSITIQITPNNNSRITSSTINVQNVQNVDISLPEIKDQRSISIASSEFLKMNKTLQNLSPTTRISSKGTMICFTTDDGVISRDTYFGLPEDGTACSFADVEPDYVQNFSSEQLVRVTKFAGLNKIMHICVKMGEPIIFKGSVGTVSNLGRIAIYLKSKELQEDEARSVERDSDD